MQKHKETGSKLTVATSTLQEHTSRFFDNHKKVSMANKAAKSLLSKACKTKIKKCCLMSPNKLKLKFQYEDSARPQRKTKSTFNEDFVYDKNTSKKRKYDEIVTTTSKLEETDAGIYTF